jgi:hypothetical protein
MPTFPFFTSEQRKLALYRKYTSVGEPTSFTIDPHDVDITRIGRDSLDELSDIKGFQRTGSHSHLELLPVPNCHSNSPLAGEMWKSSPLGRAQRAHASRGYRPVASQTWNGYQMDEGMMGRGKEWDHCGDIEGCETPNSENGEIHIYNRYDIGLKCACQVLR